MAIQVGDKIPSLTLKTMTGEGIQDISTDDLFGGKKVVLFAVPGAFTPTCSAKHLPGFVEHAEAIRAKGVDTIACVSVNDAFVMYQWGQHQGVKNVKLLPDGSGEFTRKMGMLVHKDNLGFGLRSWRYSALIDNGEIKKLFSEAGYSDNCESDPFEVSDADTMLKFVKEAFAPA